MTAAQIEGLLAKIQRLQSIMVAVATGGPKIQEKEGDYSDLYLEVQSDIEDLQQSGLAVKNPNAFHSLWDWYGCWSSNLPGYASRRQYVRDLYANIVNPLEAALYRHRTGALSSEDLRTDVERRLGQAPTTAPPSFQISIDSLHPKIIQRCRVPFETGQYDDAIFNALKTIEEEVRSRGNGQPTDMGVNLVSKTMSPSGSAVLLFSTVQAEQEAAHSLYCGAIGSFKNPLSHRFLDTSDPVKTFEALAMASLLMRMLDDAKGPQ